MALGAFWLPQSVICCPLVSNKVITWIQPGLYRTGVELGGRGDGPRVWPCGLGWLPQFSELRGWELDIGLQCKCAKQVKL